MSIYLLLTFVRFIYNALDISKKKPAASKKEDNTETPKPKDIIKRKFLQG